MSTRPPEPQCDGSGPAPTSFLNSFIASGSREISRSRKELTPEALRAQSKGFLIKKYSDLCELCGREKKSTFPKMSSRKYLISLRHNLSWGSELGVRSSNDANQLTHY